MRLDAALAVHMAGIALGHVSREYPHKLDHVLTGDADARTPRDLHPIFFGSFDWHSCVHGWWTLLTLRRLFPEMAEGSAITALADATFTTEKIADEQAYLDRPSAGGFERPYGWAWLLYLQQEAARHGDKDWGDRLGPLAIAFANRFKNYLLKLTYPITVGTHFNTAFALTLAHEWAARSDLELEAMIAEWTVRRFADERDYRGWEPGGDEFLSPALSVAVLMARILDPQTFATWFDTFLPEAALERFEPVTVSDRSDGKFAHLDGLNLSRGWAFYSLSRRLDRSGLRDRANRHLDAAMPHLSGDYMGEHWLASFALLALLAQ